MPKITHKFSVVLPNKTKCKISELKNEDYITLVKILEENDLECFFNSLNTFFSNDEGFTEDLSIIDKCYFYISSAYYSIKSYINMPSTLMGTVMIQLSDILNNIEKSYVENKLDIQRGGHVFTFGFPNDMFFQNENVLIEYASNLLTIDGNAISKEQRKILKETMGVNFSYFEERCKEHFKKEIDFITFPKNVSKTIRIDIFSELLPFFVTQIYKNTVENIYNDIYYATQYLNITYNDYMKMTPYEIKMMFDNFIKDKEKQKEEMEKMKS